MIKKGDTRIVLLVGDWAIKLPKLSSHNLFMMGCFANWNERRYCVINKADRKALAKVAPSLFTSWFGFIQIQKRVSPLDSKITLGHITKPFISLTPDIKLENFGMLQGKIVCCDYA